MSSVDVVVPCYNYARFLDTCVGSVLSQEDVDVRVLIIDDASGDETPAVGRRLAEVDARVAYRRHSKNRGHIATYNEGLLGWATAKYSLLLSADDYLAPGALSRATRVMDAHEDVGMTYGMAIAFSDDRAIPVLENDSSTDWRVLSGRRFLQYCFENALNPVPTPTAVVRTTLQRAVGGYDPEFPHTGDFEMWMRIAAHASVGVVRGIQAFYRVHGGNMSSKYYLQELGDRRERAATCHRVLERWGGRFPESRSSWANAMRESLGAGAFWQASGAFDEGDMQQCQAYLEFAGEVHPSIRRSAMWWKLRAKTLFGYGFWSKLKPHMDACRASPRNRAVEIRETSAQAGDLHGWWPGSLGE